VKTKKVSIVLEPEPPGPADPFRDRCIDAAGEMFFRSGFSRVTMDDLAARLGIGKATLYKAFSGKEELLLAVMRRDVLGTVRLIEAVLADSKAGFVERVSSWLRTVGALFASISPLLLEDLRRQVPAVWEAIDAVRHKVMMKNLEDLLRGGIAAGVFRPDLDAAFVMDVFIGLIERHLNPDAILRSGRTASGTFSALVGILFQGLLTEQGRSELPKRLDLRLPQAKGVSHE
jgi:AcrR family transcriptional regulator